jgi:hypothetical protein
MFKIIKYLKKNDLLEAGVHIVKSWCSCMPWIVLLEKNQYMKSGCWSGT